LFPPVQLAWQTLSCVEAPPLQRAVAPVQTVPHCTPVAAVTQVLLPAHSAVPLPQLFLQLPTQAWIAEQPKLFTPPMRQPAPQAATHVPLVGQKNGVPPLHAVHAPVRQARLAPQAPHVPPVVLPHRLTVSEAVARQLLPLQQPAQPEVVLQTQARPWHAWPEAQPVHPTPPVPQAVFDCAPLPLPPRQVLPLQQPVHEVVLQMHWPVAVLHVWPPRHGLQAAPPAPHDVGVSDVSATHVVPPLQQPVQPVVVSQTHAPAGHVVPVPHEPQAPPFEPQAAVLLPATQAPAEQQPPLHAV
jgi:hypothetical protein